MLAVQLKSFILEKKSVMKVYLQIHIVKDRKKNESYGQVTQRKHPDRRGKKKVGKEKKKVIYIPVMSFFCYVSSLTEKCTSKG